MIINIDTDKESPEHLRKIASFLESLAGSAVSEPVDEQAQAAAFGMFDDSADEEPKKKDDDDSMDSFTMIPY